MMSNSKSDQVYGGRLAYHGRRLNAFFLAMQNKADWEEYSKNSSAVYDRFNLTADERKLIDTKDWAGLLDAGASVYILGKALASWNVDLLDLGGILHGSGRGAFIEEQRKRVAASGEHHG
jgi:hypothetical protein